MASTIDPLDDYPWPQLPPGGTLPRTSRPSNNPPQSGLVPRSSDITVDSRDLSWNINESTAVGIRRATSGLMSGGRVSYSDTLRNTPPRECIDGAPETSGPAAVLYQQSRKRSPHPAERRTTAEPAAQSSSHQTVARRNSRDGQVGVHIVVVSAFVILTSNAPRGSLPLVKTACKVILRSLYHPPAHPTYPLGKTSLSHLGREMHRLRENHKIQAAILPLVFKQQKD